MAIGVAWYRKEDWNELMEEFEDAGNMQDSWQEWRKAAEDGIERLHKAGRVGYPVILKAHEIREFCRSRDLPNTGNTRVRLVNEKLYEIFRERELSGGDGTLLPSLYIFFNYVSRYSENISTVARYLTGLGVVCAPSNRFLVEACGTRNPSFDRCNYVS